MQSTKPLNLPDGVVLLDGGMGQELIRRGHRTESGLWSAMALLSAPEAVQKLHEDYIAAGADIITTNSYSVTRNKFATEGLEDRFTETLALSGRLAVEARNRTQQEVLIAGSLAPLAGTYRPDLVGTLDDMVPVYKEHAKILAPFVDLFLCETMSTGQEAQAAALGAQSTGKPVWVSWTLSDSEVPCLRSGETLKEANSYLEGIPVSGLFINCSEPETISTAIPHLITLKPTIAGAYANAFSNIPPDWRYHGDDTLPKSRPDMDPKTYADQVSRWITAGARVVGGCCETGPAHTRELHRLKG
jgi:S-methylmethionine-dependent homocysteine/selenocysteine methylase